MRRANADLAASAGRDGLTGLANRAGFEAALAERVARAKAEPFALLYFDLDGFKAVNDTHGHETGDRLLCEVAARARAALREGDLCARLGGDEFAAIVPDGASRAVPTRVAEALLASIA